MIHQTKILMFTSCSENVIEIVHEAWQILHNVTKK